MSLVNDGFGARAEWALIDGRHARVAGCAGSSTADSGGPIADEWTELVPRRNETSGIAFQHNPPDWPLRRRFCLRCRRWSENHGESAP
jgi:hypothetical protein